MKMIGRMIGVAMFLLALLWGVLYGLTESRLQQSYDVQVGSLTIPSSEAALAEGQRLFQARSCNDCHGDNLSGKIFIHDDSFWGMGVLAGSNLTRGAGGVGNEYQVEDWARAIRHGVDLDGSPLIFMPSHEYYPLNDEQLALLIAYIQSVPPIDHTPPFSLGLGMRWAFLNGKVPLLPAENIDHQAPRPEVIPAAVSVEYGEYLASTCFGCHGNHLAGQTVPGAPASLPLASNLTPHLGSGLGHWTEQDFIRAMREGIRPDGSKLNTFMPWKNFSAMTDLELSALWLYMQSLPALEFGA